jgi:hypothetical protein
LKFSDVVVASAALVLIGPIVTAVLWVAFAPLNSNTTSDTLASVIAWLVASLIVGSVFALKIQDESRWRAIGSIVVLSAAALLFFIAIWIANPFASPWFKDSLNSMFNTSGWTNYDWNAYSALLGSMDVVICTVMSFIGLFIGSMLRKPKKT